MTLFLQPCPYGTIGRNTKQGLVSLDFFRERFNLLLLPCLGELTLV